MQGLAHFQTYMEKFTEHVRYQGSLVALQAAALVNKLDPVDLAVSGIVSFLPPFPCTTIPIWRGRGG